MRPGYWPWSPQLQQQVDPAPGENRRDGGQKDLLGNQAAEVAAKECRGDRRRRHPGGNSPVDSARTDVGDGSCERGRRADGDVSPGCSSGVPRGEDEHWQAQAAQDEANHPAEQARKERAGPG